MELSEDRIQQECVEWFNNTFCLSHHAPRYIIMHVPNQSQQHLVKIGVLAGASDLIIIGPQRNVWWVEVKDYRGRQSDAQKAFECRLTANGHCYYLIRSLDQFKELMLKLLNTTTCPTGH